MRYAIKSGAIEKVATDCLVVPVWGKSALTTEASHLDKVSGKALSTVIKSGDFSGKLGETSLLYKTPESALAEFCWWDWASERSSMPARPQRC